MAALVRYADFTFCLRNEGFSKSRYFCCRCCLPVISTVWSPSSPTRCRHPSKSAVGVVVLPSWRCRSILPLMLSSSFRSAQPYAVPSWHLTLTPLYSGLYSPLLCGQSMSANSDRCHILRGLNLICYHVGIGRQRVWGHNVFATSFNIKQVDQQSGTSDSQSGTWKRTFPTGSACNSSI